MTPKFRRWLFIIFVITFVVMASLIIPYAFGYKLDSAGFKLQKTGMFVIDTEPKNASIYLNGKLQKNTWSFFSSDDKQIIKTPAKLSHVSPGTYRVRLEIDGYWPWEKELKINPSETTYLEDVKFFKHNLPELMFSSNLDVIGIKKSSPDRNYLAYATNQGLKLYNFKTQENKILNTDITKSINWSSASQWVFTDRLAINVNDNKVINLAKLAKQELIAPIWPATDNNQICYQNQSGVYQLDLISGQNKTILTKSNNAIIKACLIKNGYSYIIKETKGKSELIIAKPGEAKELGIIQLPRLADYQFINQNNNWLNILDPNSHKLLLIDVNLLWTNNYTLKTIENQVLASYWIDNNRLLYASEFEIWLYDLNNDKNKLLTRVGRPISNVFWHPSRNYILFTTNGSIDTLELDDRERHNITELLTMPIHGQTEMDEAGQTISFFGKIGQQEGYWRIGL